MKKYDLIIWDVDGTILDTSSGIISAAQYVIQKEGFEIPDNDIMQKFIGPPIQSSFARYLPIDATEAWRMANIFRERYKEYDLLKAIPYEGIIKLLCSISRAGLLQGVATYKRQDYVEEILQHFGITNYIDILCGSDFEGKFTKRDIIENVIRKAGVTDFRRIVMIGDTDNDLQGANELGIDFVAITYGFGFREGKLVETIQQANNVSAIGKILGVNNED